MSELRNNDDRARWAVISIWAWFIACVGLFLITFLELQNLNSYFADNDSYSNFTNNVFGWTENVFICIGLVFEILFIRWFARAYYNIGVMNGQTKYVPNLAIWCWLIPIINLILPFLLFKEMYRKAQGVLQNNNVETALNFRNVQIYWGLIIVTAIIDIVSLTLFFQSYELESTMTMYRLDLFSLFFQVPSTLILFKIVKEYESVSSSFFKLERGSDNITDHLVE